ncbi:hypothetical protein SETIT_3G388000v2 [Setaria italica]|uniref:Uncharacterized protein n=2 Tax=Setaria TaxID=4554 RepID=A0A368QNZ3_SETIT|nr:hypothetical protein SETIT_3G388000v2 [Setaria italica]TKW29574.1 hypothetical protein SEVIR_3G404500v2 [Setaria viridis]
MLCGSELLALTCCHLGLRDIGKFGEPRKQESAGVARGAVCDPYSDRRPSKLDRIHYCFFVTLTGPSSANRWCMA